MDHLTKYVCNYVPYIILLHQSVIEKLLYRVEISFCGGRLPLVIFPQVLSITLTYISAMYTAIISGIKIIRTHTHAHTHTYTHTHMYTHTYHMKPNFDEVKLSWSWIGTGKHLNCFITLTYCIILHHNKDINISDKEQHRPHLTALQQ